MISTVRSGVSEPASVRDRREVRCEKATTEEGCFGKKEFVKDELREQKMHGIRGPTQSDHFKSSKTAEISRVARKGRCRARERR